ncbi:Rhodanese-like protein [Suhomyces tanzawaensis NRRL Y-17324]|uniref:Sulfurtransferase n=1 Tax=Suhomyces tanzawaensis NRRL Y-17324 TaxID=984487 RepID=A0A1E4SSN8_9ASCO|nr:Rhodanese-like protein [Suhomyces tanzawaensis NRRL Y-17324]ODV82437.1 Rhodanese-like protein [Suhomyces tanzawaensis NRRL Y-17324]
MATKSFLSTISPTAYRALLSTAGRSASVAPIDATWYMPNNPKNGRDEYHKERIENARFFDLDATSLPGSKYPHMLPSYEDFTLAVAQLGISSKDQLVVYDKSGIFSSPRAAWTFALFGHPKVYLLDSYASYKSGEYPVDTKEPLPTPSTEAYQPISKEQFAQNYQSQVIEYDELLELVKSHQLGKQYITFDARSKDRFTGEAPEPRPGLSSGHIPGALSLPFSKLLTGEGTYKSKEELLKVFADEFGFDLSNSDFLEDKKGIIVMCGSGVTAVILKFAINSIIGLDVPVRVYDGSWTEWADRAPTEYIDKSEVARESV